MKGEFERYGFGRHRGWIGGSQLVAVLGLAGGFFEPALGALGAGGLAVQMLGAVAVRVRIRDSFLQTSPAALYFVLNVWLCLLYLRLAAG